MLRAAKHSTAEEEAFMGKLLADPPVTPTRPRGLSSHKPSPRPPHTGRGIKSAPSDQLYSAGQVDLEEEISGWDWDALSDYVPSPKKTIRAEAGHQVSTPSIASKYVQEPCIRCVVQTVMDTRNDGVPEKVRI
jgi:DNA replication ATP-dependent helicase Dna2